MFDNKIFMIGESVSRMHSSAAMLGIGLSSVDRSNPFPALYELTEDRYQLIDDYKAGFKSLQPIVYPSESYYLMDLHSLMDSWIKKNPAYGYYRIKQIQQGEPNDGDMILFYPKVPDGNPESAIALRISKTKRIIFGDDKQAHPVTEYCAKSAPDKQARRMIYDIIVRDKPEDGYFVLERLSDDVVKSMVKEQRANRDSAKQDLTD